MTDLTAPRFASETAARKHLERVRWPDGPICPHCGSVDNASRIKGKSARPGLWFCGDCRKQFTVTVGTLFERSKVPLHKWLLAVHLLASSKKGVSAHQIHRTLGVTYKTAWFMCHRIREAMADDYTSGPLGGSGKVVEADETYIGRRKGVHGKGVESKYKIVTLVERGGRARSTHVKRVNAHTVKPILAKHAWSLSKLYTDESSIYTGPGYRFAEHQTVNHSKKEYGRGEVHTNTIEGYFSIFKRGMIGTYQHCGERHLKRYLAEFDFRYSNRQIDDFARSDVMLAQIGGKRLTYRRINPGPVVY
jgi:transposase-like protein